jgi:hypothetical protein
MSEGPLHEFLRGFGVWLLGLPDGTERKTYLASAQQVGLVVNMAITSVTISWEVTSK